MNPNPRNSAEPLQASTATSRDFVVSHNEETPASAEAQLAYFAKD